MDPIHGLQLFQVRFSDSVDRLVLYMISISEMFVPVRSKYETVAMA